MLSIETQDNEFHDGNGTTELGTILPAWWLNQIQAELLEVVRAGGLTPNKAQRNQVLAALQKLIADAASPLQQSIIAAAPSGQIGLFAMDYAPAGWLKANGAAVSRTVYAKLFAAIGTRFGAGDGYSTFNLPDLRGEFARFWDDGRGVDAGRALGSFQSDAVQKWEAVFTYQRAQVHGVEKREGAFMLESEHDFGDALRGDHWATSHAHIGPAVNNAARTASETRPRNIALLACIKI